MFCRSSVIYYSRTTRMGDGNKPFTMTLNKVGNFRANLEWVRTGLEEWILRTFNNDGQVLLIRLTEVLAKVWKLHVNQSDLFG